MLEQFKQKYDHYISIKHTLDRDSSNIQLQEILKLFMKISKTTSQIAKTLVISQLNLLADQSITWARKKRQELETNPTDNPSVVKMASSVLNYVLAEASWFPRSRL
jgi:hypothetical protein